MQKVSNFLIIFLLLITQSILSQSGIDKNKIQWKVLNDAIKQDFINKYIEVLKDDEIGLYMVQKSDQLYITIEVSSDTTIDMIDQVKIEALNPSRGEYKTLYNEALRRIRDDVKVLIERKYEWDNLDLEEKYDLGTVFKEISYKELRDNFYWTYRNFSFIPGLSSYYKPHQFPKYGFYVEFGNEEFGFPSSTVQSMNIGIVNEIVKAFITLPVNYWHIGNFERIQTGDFGCGIRFDSPYFGGSVCFQETSSIKNSDLNDTKKRIYNPWACQLYFSHTNSIPSFDIPKFINVSSSIPVRIKVGASFMDMLYLQPNAHFGSPDEYRLRTASSNFSFLIRLECVSSYNNNLKANRHSIALQTNIWLGGLGNIFFKYSYVLKKYFNLGIAGVIYWNDLDFEDNIYHWQPGFMILPTFSLSL